MPRSRLRPDPRPLRRFLAWLAALLIPLLACAGPLAAAPVDWREVPATADGRQWWDAGSLRFSREGYLTVLSRFQPAAPAPEGAPADAPPPRPAASTLYVMEIDCDESLYRDRSVNGFHQFSPQWQPVVADDLIGEVLHQACGAATPSATPSAPATPPAASA